MDIAEFEKQFEPRAKRSRLEPFRAQILELKAKGYANDQVAQWLATNGVTISSEGVRIFTKRPTGSSASRVSRLPAETLDSPSAEDPTPQELLGKSKNTQDRIRRERHANQFINDGQSSNAVLNLLKDKTQ